MTSPENHVEADGSRGEMGRTRCTQHVGERILEVQPRSRDQVRSDCYEEPGGVVMLGRRVRRWLALMQPVVVSAHCDTAGGPAVTDGRTALETGNVNHALKWVPVQGEAEVREVFDKALTVRALGVEAAEVADRLFLETLVRIHRMGEGEPFTGIQPTGAAVDPVVQAADAAIAAGSDADLLPLVAPERRAQLHDRFQAALSLRDFDVDDLVAARRYIAAYVDFFKFAEGEDHHHSHAPDHHAAT